MTKNIFGDDRVVTTLITEKSSFKCNTTDLWPEFGFFKQQPCGLVLKKRIVLKTQCFLLTKPITVLQGQ